MTVRVYKNAEAIGKAAASLFAATVIRKPDCVLGFATGSTPVPTYQALSELYRDGAVDFSRVTTYNLDEYVGLGHEHEQSYYYFMTDNLFRHINVPKENIHVLSGTAKDPAAECAAYDAAIDAAGGIDLQILGIGNNGHIAFNEPASTFAPTTHVVNLTESTIQANKRFFEKVEDVPTQAYTMGIKNIMQARKVLLIVSGEGKAEILDKVLYGPVTPQVPASILQMHPDVTIVADEAALSKCNL